LISDIANRLGVLGVGYNPAEGWIYKTGLRELVADFEGEDQKELFQVIEDFEAMDDRLEGLMKHIGKGTPAVFIGPSPITKSHHLSVIADCFNLEHSDIMLVAIGPKRMNYEKNIALFKKLKEVIEQT
jgi:transcriptional regulator of heat shock response